MEIARIEVNSVYARIKYRRDIPRGIAGARVTFLFTDSAWDLLEKIAVFQGACTRIAELENDSAVIPQEVTALANVPVRVGVYGCNAEKGLAIPTLWADLDIVKAAPDPSGDPAGDPEFTPWVELRQDVGNPEDLQTDTKENLVAAINETASKAKDAGEKVYELGEVLAGDLEEVKQSVEDLAKVADAERLATMEKNIADLMYIPIAVTSFAHTAGTREMGETLRSLTLKWALNKEPTALSVAGEAVSGKSGEITLADLQVTQDASWQLTATDERGTQAKAETSLRFYNGVYYGAAAAPEALDSAFVLSLGKILTGSRGRTVTVTAAAGEHIWYALPVRLGKCSFAVGGFEGGFDLVATQDFTNAQGYTEPYYIYRSGQTGLGETKVVVS